MHNKFIAAAVASAFLLPTSANAVQVVGEKLEVYGKVHLSVDSSDRDDPADSSDGLSISSNSSRLGFKGKLPAGGMNFVYKMEQEVRMDQGGAEFASRNTYAGLASGPNMVIVGKHDTPFKTVGSKWGVFGDSVGERRSILGAGYSEGNSLNERAENMIMYQYKGKSVKVQLMHAVDPESNDGGVDNNDENMTGAGVFYKAGKLWLAAGYETWEGHSDAADADMYRLAATYDFGMMELGAIFENIDSDTVDEFKRDVWGVNGVFRVGSKTDFRVQYLVADEAENSPETGGSKIGVGIYHKMDKNMKVYAAYGATDNDANAQFQAVDGGHGDEVTTVAGGSPSSISVGFEYKF